MSELNSAEYYRAREQRERGLATAASDPAIAKIHTEMADRYADLVGASASESGSRPLLRVHAS